MRRNKSIKVLLQWVQYFYRISLDPTIVDLNKVIFIQQLDTALYRAYIKKKLVDQSNTKAKETSLGPLESENKFKEWESNFIDFFSHSLELMDFPCLTWCVKTTIQMQMGNYPTLLIRLYHVIH